MKDLSQQNCNLLYRDSLKGKTDYPKDATCGKENCQKKPWYTYTETGSSDWDFIDPACSQNGSKKECPVYYKTSNFHQNLLAI